MQTKISLKEKFVNYEYFGGSDVTNEKVLNENECHQMNEGMWQTVEYLTSKLQKPLVRSDSNTYDSLSFLEDEPPGKVIIHKLRGEVSLVKQDTIEFVF